ncbi:hypothetical protein BDR26DRAFT_901758 [Obelidium mucronatum]|nr:hypothetical protein BDR26DRAFT_901758 [Obelidium mucronatum]
MSCVPLAQSTLCPGFRQYNAYVNLGQDVDAYIAESVRVSPSEFGFGQAMVTQYGCPGWTGAGLRYHLSALCALLVSNGNAAGCNAPVVAPLPLCASTLGAYVASFAGVAADAAVCPDASAARADYAAAFAGLLPLASDAAGCVAAEPVDAANCGFATPPEAAAFCAASADACCAAVNPAASSAAAATTTAAPLQTSAVAATTATTTTTTTKPASSPPASESSGGLSSQTIIYIAAGGGGGVLLILAIVLFLCCYKRRKSNATAAATYTVNEKGALTTAAPVYGKTHVAVHGYSPIQNDELGIQAGDSIVIKTEYDDGWAFGFNTVTRQEGYFPVEVLKEFSNGNNFNGGNKRVSSYYGGGNGNDSVYDGPNNNNNQSVYDNTQSVYDNNNTQSVYDPNANSIYAPTNTDSMYYGGETVAAAAGNEMAQLGPDQAIYPFVPSRDDELALKAGDRVVVTKAFDDGWCFGKHVGNNREGYFPFDCLASYETGHKTAAKSGAGKKQRISSIYESEYGGDNNNNSPAEKPSDVIFDYTPMNHDELALRTGERVVIKHAYDDGWGFGLNVNTQKEGVFPLDCLAGHGNQQQKQQQPNGERFSNRVSSMYAANKDSMYYPQSDYGANSVYNTDSMYYGK